MTLVTRIKTWRPAARPWWSWAGLGAIAALALGLYLWGLSRNGMANDYYAAAVKSGSVSWKAWFFGALDPGSFITVDKLPASLWLEGLSARLFGFSSWSMLLPEALAGVGSVLIVYRLVRRWQGDLAGLLAALALAVTPVAVAMFRYNNPDALLTLLLLAAAWSLWSALEKGATWKMVACGALVGFAFLTKMLEAFVVLPVFVVVYLACGPRGWWRRVLQVFAAGAALVAAGGWYLVAVAAWPATSRPYIGGSGDNSVLGLVLSRTAGYSGGSPGGPNFAGVPGWLRMFNAELGGQAAWLVILALAGLVAGLWFTWRGRRTDLGRAGYVLWGGWALVCLGVFSFAKGVLHPYYTVVLAPALAALCGGGTVALWKLGRRHLWLAWLLPAAVLATAFVSFRLLGRTPSFAPGLGWAVLACGGLAAVLLALTLTRVLNARAVGLVAGAVALVCVLAGPTAYSVATVARSVTGPLAAAGPSAAGLGDGFGVLAGGGPGGFPGAGNPGAFPGGALGGLSTADPASQTALAEYLLANQGGAEYLVAVQSAQAAVPLILATGRPVIAMGGFNGLDAAPTLAEFQRLAEDKKVRYVLLGGLGSSSGGPPPGFPGGGGPPPGLVSRDSVGSPAGAGLSSTSVAQWVQANATVVDAGSYGGSVGGVTLYRLW